MQGGVINSTGSHASSMDGAAGTTSAAGPSVTATQTQSKLPTATGVVTVVSEATSVVGKTGTTAVQTLNGSTVLVNCHIPGGGSVDSSGHNSQPAVSHVNNGPISVSKESVAISPATPSTIIRTCQTSTQNTVISTQQTAKSVPTVTLVRPPMQTPSNTSQSGGNPSTVLTPTAVAVSSTSGSLQNKLDSTKAIIQTGGHIVVSTAATGATATVRSPTILQTLRTSVPSSIATTPTGGVRPLTQQVLAPRLTQPQTNTANIQNIQLPPGNYLLLDFFYKLCVGFVKFL